jgi:hypothetical protein
MPLIASPDSMDGTQIAYGSSLAFTAGDRNPPLEVRTAHFINYGRRLSGQSAPGEGPNDGLDNTLFCLKLLKESCRSDMTPGSGFKLHPLAAIPGKGRKMRRRRLWRRRPAVGVVRPILHWARSNDGRSEFEPYN